MEQTKDDKLALVKVAFDVAGVPGGDKWWVVRRVFVGPDLDHFEEMPEHLRTWGPFRSEEVAERVCEVITPSEAAAWQAFLAKQNGPENMEHVGSFEGVADRAEVSLAVEAATERLAGGKVEEII